MNGARVWPEAVGYGQAAAVYWPADADGGGGPEGIDYGASDRYEDAAAGPGWAAVPDEDSWPESEDWREWGPPPALHPDHPSAPVPRVQLPGDHPSGPLPAARAPSGPDLPRRRPGGSARTWNQAPQAPDAGRGDGNRRLYAVPDHASAADRQAAAPRGHEYLGRQAPSRRAAEPDGSGWRETSGLHRQPGRPEAAGYYRELGPEQREALGWQDASGYRRENGSLGPATGRFQDPRSPQQDPRRMAGQVLELHHGQVGESGHVSTDDDRAARIARDAQGYATAIREAAERDAAAITQQAASRADAIAQEAASRAEEITQLAANRADVITQRAAGEAAAIREAAERDAAELRARLDSMSGELNRVAAYVTENLADSAMSAAPALPDARPALPGNGPAHPGTRPGRPAPGPARPKTGPGRTATGPGRTAVSPGRTATSPGRPSTGLVRPDGRPASPPRPNARPGTGPAELPAAPGGKPQKRTRQQQAMRIATAATAALFSIAVITGAGELATHGYKFFVFRPGGVGSTAGNETDQQFLAKEAAAAHHQTTAPKGRHHKKTHRAAEPQK